MCTKNGVIYSKAKCFILSGTYKIDVLQGAKPVLGSPFFCQAFDVSKVKLQELGPMTVSVHDHIAFKSK